jgi:hypothetical protein
VPHESHGIVLALQRHQFVVAEQSDEPPRILMSQALKSADDPQRMSAPVGLIAGEGQLHAAAQPVRAARAEDAVAFL